MRRWNVAGGSRSVQRESTETRCSRAASASSRRAASDGSVWCFWRRLGGLLGGLGPAVSLGVGPLRALRQRAGQAAQEADRLGLAAARLGEALVPRARDSGRR